MPLPVPLTSTPTPTHPSTPSHCRRGLEVEVRPPRLGLARVSVLRGQGAAKCTACIDDYIKCAEPVFDYLTKFRWVAGHPS